MRKIVLIAGILLAGILIYFGLFEAKVSKRPGSSLLIWHWMTDRHKSFLKLAERYQKETGMTVSFELYAPSDVFSTKVRAAAQTNTLPDIFGVLGESDDLASFINAKLVHRLSPYLEENNGAWQKEFFSKALGMTTFVSVNQWKVPEGIYGIPIDVTNLQILYNKGIFQKAGIQKIPETWEEFISAGEAVISKTGKQFLVIGFGEPWIIISMMRNFAYNLMGEEKFVESIKGTFPYSSPEWIDIFKKFRELSDKKLLASGVVTMINKSAERLFATERAAITYNGSWSVNVFKGMNPRLNYGIMFFPRISDNFPVVIHGGAGSSLVVSENSSKKTEAINFLRWLTSKESQIFLSNETNNLPSNKNAVGEMLPILNDYAKDMDHTIHPALLPVAEDPDIEEAIARGIQSIIIGETTPEMLGADLTALKKKSLEKKNES